jgi:hypothetical protein
VNAHPLAAILDAAASGSYPPADGAVDVLPPVDHLAGIALGFTAHFVFAGAIDVAAVRARTSDGDLSVPMSARFLNWLADELGSNPGTFDALFCARGTGTGAPSWLHEIDAPEHPRVQRASRYRRDMRVYGTESESAVLVVGRGVCDRWEIGYEVAPSAQGQGLGRRLVAAARGLVPEGVPVWAQVAPGNAASMRSTAAGGFSPVAAEVLFPRGVNRVRNSDAVDAP